MVALQSLMAALGCRGKRCLSVTGICRDASRFNSGIRYYETQSRESDAFRVFGQQLKFLKPHKAGMCAKSGVYQSGSPNHGCRALPDITVLCIRLPFLLAVAIRGSGKGVFMSSADLWSNQRGAISKKKQGVWSTRDELEFIRQVALGRRLSSAPGAKVEKLNGYLTGLAERKDGLIDVERCREYATALLNELTA